MSKVEEARAILKELQVPAKQQADLCCFVLLAMANIKEQDLWLSATNEQIRIHDVIAYTKEYYGVAYAENSRETFRKQAMHHFRNAAFIEDNGKATNSPNYCYRLTDEMLSLIRNYGTESWQTVKAEFLNSHETLVSLYAFKRTMRKMPDVVLYSKEKNWLYFIESVTSVGPMEPKRIKEIEEMTEGVRAGKIYVTAFLDFKTFKKFSETLAWETEVWIADMPDHMIHLNGDKFLGPRK